MSRLLIIRLSKSFDYAYQYTQLRNDFFGYRKASRTPEKL